MVVFSCFSNIRIIVLSLASAILCIASGAHAQMTENNTSAHIENLITMTSTHFTSLPASYEGLLMDGTMIAPSRESRTVDDRKGTELKFTRVQNYRTENMEIISRDTASEQYEILYSQIARVIPSNWQHQTISKSPAQERAEILGEDIIQFLDGFYRSDVWYLQSIAGSKMVTIKTESDRIAKTTTIAISSVTIE